MPDTQSHVDADLVRRLVDEQLAPADPSAREQPITFVTSGWDNAILRLGTDRVVRLPRHETSARLLENEARWLPLLGPTLPVEVPVPTFVGRPGHGHAWSWTIAPWLPGETVERLAPAHRGRLAVPLADVLHALHRPAPSDAPVNPYRGVALRHRDGVVADRLEQIGGQVGDDVARRLRAIWQAGLQAPEWPGPPLWLHGDPHPHNVLQVDGELSGLIDFGDVTAGDPASDVATAWLTFEGDDRHRFLSRLLGSGAYDPALPARAAAWAVAFVTAVAVSPKSQEPFAGLVTHAIGQLLDDHR